VGLHPTPHWEEEVMFDVVGSFAVFILCKHYRGKCFDSHKNKGK
jgi:hypothetical protein